MDDLEGLVDEYARYTQGTRRAATHMSEAVGCETDEHDVVVRPEPCLNPTGPGWS